MSDGFQPARVGDVTNRGPFRPLSASSPPKDAPQTDPFVHFAAIADEIIAAFRHLSDMLPAAAPLARTAAAIEARLAEVRAIIHPPRDVAGPQQDHS